jgi:hypothetical protein
MWYKISKRTIQTNGVEIPMSQIMAEAITKLQNSSFPPADDGDPRLPAFSKKLETILKEILVESKLFDNMPKDKNHSPISPVFSVKFAFLPEYNLPKYKPISIVKASYAPGADVIKFTINLSVPAQMEEMQVTIKHEIIHALQEAYISNDQKSLISKHYSEMGDKYDDEGDYSENYNKEYYNTLSEIMAYTGAMEKEIGDTILTIKGNTGYNDLQYYLLRNSQSYRQMLNYLTPENKKYILKIIATYLINRGQIKRAEN